MKRYADRSEQKMRPVSLTLDANKYAEGSCLVSFGDTRVMCTASVEEKVPAWLKGTKQGWVTAEYGMLPRSTAQRMDREAKKGQGGRTHEIQRLIGRALRAGVDLTVLDGLTIHIDCDVIQADGGTRTASITGGFMALYLACQKLVERGRIPTLPITHFVAAISCGMVDGSALLDLDYSEDSRAETDANFVFLDTGTLVEAQATAEHRPFSKEEFLTLFDLADKATKELIALQKKTLLLRSTGEK